MTPEELLQGLRSLQNEVMETEECCWKLREDLRLAIMKARILKAQLETLRRHREQSPDA
jgi:hypothetical protein